MAKRLRMEMTKWAADDGLLRRYGRSLTAVRIVTGCLVGLAALLSWSPRLLAQPTDATELTLEDIFLSPKFDARDFDSGRWSAEGPIITFIRTGDDGTTDLVSLNLESSTEKVLVDGGSLTGPDTRSTIKIENYEMNAAGTSLLLFADAEKVWRRKTKGYYYLLDLSSGKVKALSDRELGYQMFAKFDPTGRRVGFVRNRNLFVVDLTSGKETQLTRDGGPGAIINGTSDWVYEEEFGVRDAWRWSPNGRYIAFLQFDETRTRDYWLPDYRGLYPEFKRFRYPKAGERNSEIRAGIIDLDSMRTSFFDTGTWYSNENRYEYLNAIGWTPTIDSTYFAWVFRMNRDQNRLDLVYLDPVFREASVVLSEEEATYINAETGFSELDISKLTYLKDGKHFVWISEVDGYRHLYLHRNNGERIGLVTDGSWDVTEFNGVDEAGGYVYFTATIDGSTERHLYRLPFSPDSLLSGEEPQRLTTGEGWHKVSVSPDRKYFIDRYSTTEIPETVTLFSIDGVPLSVLESNQELVDRLASYDLRPLDFERIPAADGEPLNAFYVKPSDFDVSRSYPLLMYVYGGPGSQRVLKQWFGNRRLWFQLLADKYDLVIVCVDGRGTGGQGKAFEASVYRQLGVLEAQDQIAATQWLTKQPFIDGGRVGIWGWSYGGFATLMSMFTGDGPDTFDYGIAVAPVTTWRQYDTIYTERYMSTPENNPEGYALGSPISHVERMADGQRLLVVHGDMDDNVHFQNTVQLVDALQKAGKQFEMMIYPGKDHAISGRPAEFHLHSLMTRFVASNL